ncbi:MAG: hypothetical protein AB7Q27_16650 [Acidimicrobiia bacterium]
MSPSRSSPFAPFGAVAAAVGLCCGFPLLAAVGLTGAIAGVGIGSWLLASVATLVAVAGFVRWRRSAPTDTPNTELDDGPPPLRSAVAVSSGRRGLNDEVSL